MADFGPSVILAFLLMLLLGILAAMLMAWGWLIWRVVTGQPILPQRPLVSRRETPWRVGTILLIVLSYAAVSFSISMGYHAITGRRLADAKEPAKVEIAVGVPDEQDKGESLKPKESIEGMHATADSSKPAKSSQTAPAGAAAGIARVAEGAQNTHNPDRDKKLPWAHMMLLNSLVDIILVVLTPYIVRKTSGARLRDFGLSLDGWQRQAACGVVATLIAAPPVFAIQLAAVRIWDPQAHPLMTMMFEDFSFGTAVLAVVAAVILAPMFEELAFRGLLQSWLVGLLERSAREASLASFQEIPTPFAAESVPPLEFWEKQPEDQSLSKVATISGPPSVKIASRSWLAIVLTSILFAGVHAPQWPAPIPLFALALVIGTVYYRTGSLITSIFMHATFNGISTLMLFIAVLSPRHFAAEKLPVEVTVEIRQRLEVAKPHPPRSTQCMGFAKS